MILICARASAQYSGRIDAELALGDVIIQIRDAESGGDGSVLIHSMYGGLPPKNWMPAGSEYREEAGYILCVHRRREEQLEVWIEQEYSRQQWVPSLKGEIAKLGAERDFSDALATKPHLLEKGLRIMGREYRTSAGPIDIMGYHLPGIHIKEKLPVFRGHHLVAVEVKRRRADPSAWWQMRRYLDALSVSHSWCVRRGILAAPSLANATRTLLEERPEIPIRFVRVHWEDVK